MKNRITDKQLDELLSLSVTPKADKNLAYKIITRSKNMERENVSVFDILGFLNLKPVSAMASVLLIGIIFGFQINGDNSGNSAESEEDYSYNEEYIDYLEGDIL